MAMWRLRAAALGLALTASLSGAPARAAPEGEMTWALHATLVPNWLDPSISAGQYTGYILIYALHDALVKPMPGQPLASSLAESWTVSPDGKVYEFVLRKGVTFHNGDPVTSADVKFSFERYRAGPTSPIKARVAEVQTPLPEVARFVLKEPWPDFMTYYGALVTSAGWIVPKAYIERVGEDGYKKHPIGAGPYRFVSFTPGVELVLEAYDKYWRKPPEVKRIVIKSVPEEATRVAMLKRGESDIAYVLNGPLAEEVQNTGGLTLAPTYPPATIWLTLTEQFDPKSPWSDLGVRQAANLAINRKAINEALYLGHGKSIGTMVLPDLAFAWTAPEHAYDPEKAKQLLKEAGHPNGFDGGELFTDLVYAPAAEAAANDLAAIGIRLRLRPLERAGFFSQWAEKKLHGVILSAIGGFGNAATWVQDFVTTGGRYTDGTYPEMDDLFRRQAAELDPAKRTALLEALQRAMYDKAMFVPIVQIPGLSGVGPRVAHSGLGDIQSFSFSAPYEDVKLKRR